MEEFNRLLQVLLCDVAHAFSDEDQREDRSSFSEINIYNHDSYKELIRYFEQRTQRPLDWVKLSQRGPDLLKVFEAGRGSEHWRVVLDGRSDEEATKELKKINPALYCKDGYPQVPAEAVQPAVVYTQPHPSSYLGSVPAGGLKPFRCPICNGTGLYDRPVVAGGSTECRACKGACIVWG